jgi:hypothetical protein
MHPRKWADTTGALWHQWCSRLDIRWVWTVLRASARINGSPSIRKGPPVSHKARETEQLARVKADTDGAMPQDER